MADRLHAGRARSPLYERIQPDPADVARLTPLGHPTINLDGRYRTTSRPPADSRVPDRALLLIGFTIGARASELSALTYQDLVSDPGRGLYTRLSFCTRSRF